MKNLATAVAPFAYEPHYATTPKDVRPARCIGSGADYLGVLALTITGYVHLGTASTGACYVFDCRDTGREIGAISITDFPQVLATHAAAAYSPWVDHLKQMRKDFGLTVGAFAETLAVSRQSYYDWVSGEIPNSGNQERIGVLAAIAREWASLGLGAISRYWLLPAAEGGQSLKGYLTGAELSSDRFQRLVTSLGLGKRLLPPRGSVARSVKTSGTRRGRISRPWHVDSGDSE